MSSTVKEDEKMCFKVFFRLMTEVREINPSVVFPGDSGIAGGYGSEVNCGIWLDFWSPVF